MRYRSECTKPSISQSLVNLVANVHLQAISTAKTKILPFHSETIRHCYQINSLCLIRSFVFGVYTLLANCRGASEFAFALGTPSLRPQCTQLQIGKQRYAEKKFEIRCA